MTKKNKQFNLAANLRCLTPNTKYTVNQELHKEKSKVNKVCGNGINFKPYVDKVKNKHPTTYSTNPKIIKIN
jgi:hypothetical protein